MNKVSDIMDLLAISPSTNDKIGILRDNINNDLLKKVMKYTYDKEMKYGISNAQLRKESDGRRSKFKDIFTMLDELATSNINNDLRMEVLAFLEENSEMRDFYEKMITKDFKNGVKLATLLKVWKDLVFEFKVQKPEAMAKLKLKKDELFALFLKENGIRGTYVDGKFLSRQGKSLKHMDHIVEEIENVFGKDFVVDGELVRDNFDNVDDNENLRLTISIVNSDDYSEDKRLILFKIFDIISLKEYQTQDFCTKFVAQRLKMKENFNESLEKCNYISNIEKLYVGTDQAKIQEWLDWADKNDKEGLVLYKDTPMKLGKTTNVVKIKTFYYDDLRVIDVFYGEVGTRLEGRMVGFVVDYKGNPLKISGLKESDREEFEKDPKKYIGRVIEIKYKSKSKNKDGKESVQFGVYSRLREEGKEVSYEG